MEGKILVEEGYEILCHPEARMLCQPQGSWALEGYGAVWGWGAGKGKENCRAIGMGVGKIRELWRELSNRVARAKRDGQGS